MLLKIFFSGRDNSLTDFDKTLEINRSCFFYKAQFICRIMSLRYLYDLSDYLFSTIIIYFMRFYITWLVSLVFAATAVAQESRVDSLRRVAHLEKDIPQRIEILDQLARELLRISPEKALKSINLLKLNVDSINSEKGHAHYYRLMSSYSAIMGNYLYSTSFNYEAMRMYEHLHDSLGIGNCFIAQAYSYYRQQLYAEAIQEQKKALRIFEALHIPGRIIACVSSLALLYDRLGFYDSALMMATHSMELNKDKHFYAVFISDNKTAGDAYLHTRQYDKALTYFREAIRLDEAAGGNTNNEAITEALLGLGKVAMETNNKREGYAYLQQAVNKARKNGFMSLLLEGYGLLAKYHNQKKNPDEAYRYLLLRTVLTDSLDFVQREERLKFGDVYLNAFRESHQNELLIKEKELRENLLKQQRIGIAFGVITIGILLMLLYFLKKSKTRQEQTNALLTTQKEEIDAQKNELKKLSDTKDKFFSIISHDLRSPLNSLKSFTSFIHNYADSISKDEMITTTKQLDNTLDNTIKLTENLLAWARQQMKLDESKPVNIPVLELVDEVMQVYKDAADRKGIQLEREMAENVIVHADRNQLLFVVRNLVNNAIKFTPIGGNIKVKSSLIEGRVEITVSDNGIGMNATKLSGLFQVGNAAVSLGTSGEKGTGLGLVLCKDFVQQNNGTLIVNSKENEGSVFTVRLPGLVN